MCDITQGGAIALTAALMMAETPFAGCVSAYMSHVQHMDESRRIYECLMMGEVLFAYMFMYTYVYEHIFLSDLLIRFCIHMYMNIWMSYLLICSCIHVFMNVFVYICI